MRICFCSMMPVPFISTQILSNRFAHFGHLGTADFGSSSIVIPSNLKCGRIRGGPVRV